MIYITQGHQDSIALEILFKSLLELNQEQIDNFVLIVSKKDLEKNLKLLNLDYKLESNYLLLPEKQIPVLLFETATGMTGTTQSLEIALHTIDPSSDLLLTLPTSKDQLLLNDKQPAGYTEYFRTRFNDQNIAMLFKSDRDNFLLITDHIPIRKISEVVTPELIFNKVSSTIDAYKKYFDILDQIIFSGINPHVGENGILGDEDIVINKAIAKLTIKYSHLDFRGPFSGDTLHSYRDSSSRQLFIYMYHDQGLPVFKERNGLVGLNISVGMPFLRMSVDHGTAFSLAGKNIANHSGCLYMVKEALKIQERLWKAKK